MNSSMRWIKRVALLVAVLAISLSTNAQTWYVMGEYIWSPPNPQGTYLETHYQAEAVVIDGTEYNTIYVQGQGVLLGAYRSDGNQVYYRKWNGSSYDGEVLLYDYDLEEGDFFNDEDEHPMWVTEVSSIVDWNGVERKMISFSFMGLENESEFWIEGVGSSKGFVNSGNYTPTSDGAIFHLLCYHIGDGLIYVNPEYDTCDVDDVEENGGEKDVVVYPNPANEIVKLLSDNNAVVERVDIVDVCGRVVKRVENRDGIDISDLPNGQYFVRIKMADTTIVKKLSVVK